MNGWAPDDEAVAALATGAIDVHARLGGDRPVLVVDVAMVEQRTARLAAALPDAELHYAVKANSHPGVLRAVRATGVGAEVASFEEAMAAVRAGWRADDLWCTRLHVHPSERRRLVALGVRRFVVDGDDAAEACAGSDLLVRVDVGLVGLSSWPLAGRDGLSPDAAVALAARHRRVLGPAFHVGSQQGDPTAWGDVARLLVEAFDAPPVVDAGGGFPAAGLVGGRGPADWDEAGQHLARAIPSGTRLIAEPGRALVADAGALVATVLGTSARGDERWCHLDVGVYTGLPEAAGEAIAWRSWSPDAVGAREPWCVAGPSCDSTDVLARATPWWLPHDLAAGDRIVLFGTGAYTTGYLPDGPTGFNGLPIPHIVVR